jgi:hypothetical protein
MSGVVLWPAHGGGLRTEVTRLQGESCRYSFNELRYSVNHERRVSVHAPLSVDLEPHLQCVGVGHGVGGNNVGQRVECVHALADRPRKALQRSGSEVVK